MAIETTRSMEGTTMITLTRSYACSALLLISLMTVFSFAAAAYALTRQPTTLIGMLAVRAPISGCHTPAAVASTGSLKASLQSDQQGHIGLRVERTLETGPDTHHALGNPPVIITERRLAVVDASAMVHRPVDRSRFGMLVTQVNLPC
jgi:hypothetical protein